MIIKRLRSKNNWSQEQLSTFSGLSLRTIQRIESGQKASKESIMSLAAVFNIESNELEQEFLAIDKKSKEWQQNPWWVKSLFWGSNHLWLKNRRQALTFELFIVFIAVVFLIAAAIQPASDRVFLFSLSLTCAFNAYLWSVLVRLSDRYHIWQTDQ